MNGKAVPRDKINEIHAFFVNDSDLIDSFLVCIKSNSFQKYPEVWIDEQVHLLLFPKKTKSSMVGIPEEPAVLLGTSSSPIAVQPPEIPAILSSIPEPLRESDIMLRVLGATMHVKQKKPKKRLAPTAVATPSVATMPLPAAEEPAAEVNPRDSFGISVPVGNILPADALYACCSTRPAENVPVEDILTASNDVPLAANCLSEPLLVDNGLSVLRVGTSLNGDSSDAGEMRRDRDLLTVSEVRTLVNISAVYAALVVHLYIPFAVGVPFLAKLLGAVVNQNKPGTLPTPSPCVFKSIIHVHVFAAKAVEFCLPLFGHLGSDLALELVNCTALSTYCPEAAQLLRSLADDSFTEREKRVGGAAVGYGSPDAVAGDLGRRDAFIRPFRADEDDRNLYKTQHECAIFNEREKLYDEISDLYRNYQDSVSSDLDGSKIEDFWRHMARVCLKMIGGLRDCNISWFADLIMRMLLHYGTNIATHSALVPSQHIIKPSAGGLDQSSIVKPSIASTDSKQRLLEARMGTGGIGQTNSFGRGPNRVIRPSSSSSSSATTQINRNASDAMHTSSNRVSNQPQLSPAVNLSNSALLSQPTVLFPGNQQFFFRFFIQCDSYRLCQYLNILMWAELESITEQALHNLSIGDSFTLCLYKLSILGRFLGLLHFSPHWILSVPKDSLDSGPLRNLAERISDVRKNRFISHVSGKVNLLDIVQTSMREKRLCLTIPWVAEFLKLMAWDGTIVACASTSTVTKTANLTIGGNASGGVHQEIACVQYLVTLLFADRQILEKETMSSNRVFVLFVLEGFVGSLPYSLRHIDRKSVAEMNASRGLAGVSNSSTTSSTFSNLSTSHYLMDLDDKNWAFTKPLFNEMISPFVSRALRYLRHPRGSVLSRSRSASASSLQTPSLPPPPIAGSLRIVSSTSVSSVNIYPTTPSTLHSRTNFESVPSQSETSVVDVPFSGSARLDADTRSLDLSTLDNVSRTLFCSSPEGGANKAKGIDTFSVVHDQGPTAQKKVPEPLNFIVPISSSPIAFAVLNDEICCSESPPSVNPIFEFFPSDNTVETSNRRIGFSPATLAETINNSNGMVVGVGPPATPTSGGQPPALVLTPSLSRQLSSTGKSSMGLVSENKSAGKRLKERLELAFWRQHDHIFRTSRFYLDQLENGLKMQLKEIRVAEAIHLAWDISEARKDEILNKFKDALKCNINGFSGDLVVIREEYKTIFKHMLQSDFRRVHKDAMNNSAMHAELTTAEFFITAFPQLLKLYPSNDKVIALSLHLIRSQVEMLIRQLLGYLDSYGMQKLEDVCRVSCAQFSKLIEKQPVNIVSSSQSPISKIPETIIARAEVSSTTLIRHRKIEFSIMHALRHECFSTAATSAHLMVFRTLTNSPLQPESKALSWNDMTANLYTFSLQEHVEKDLKNPSKSVYEARNMIWKICELISDLFTSTCEILVFESSFSSGFLSKAKKIAQIRRQPGKGIQVVLQGNAFGIPTYDSPIISTSDVNTVNRSIFAIHNVFSLCKILFESLVILSSKVRPALDQVEVLGALHVEVMKMLSVTSPTLIYLDAILFAARHSAPPEVPVRHFGWPSDLMSMAVEFYFIDKMALGRIIIGTAKPSQVTYHEDWRNYESINDLLAPFILNYLCRFITPSISDGIGTSNVEILLPVQDMIAELKSDFVEQLLKLFPPEESIF